MAIKPIHRTTINRQTARKGKRPAVGLMQQMLPHAEQAATLLRALANEQRLMILCNLSAGELSVGQLNERVPLNQSALSQHLAVLRKSGAVNTRREAQTVYYSLTPGRYVGAAPDLTSDDDDFEQTLRDIHEELIELNDKAVELTGRIGRNFEVLLG